MMQLAVLQNDTRELFKNHPQVCHRYITRSELPYVLTSEYCTVILSAFQGILHAVPAASAVMFLFPLISDMCGMNTFLPSLPPMSFSSHSQQEVPYIFSLHIPEKTISQRENPNLQWDVTESILNTWPKSVWIIWYQGCYWIWEEFCAKNIAEKK